MGYMNKEYNDIRDDEIRIITANESKTFPDGRKPRFPRRRGVVLVIIIVLLLVLGIVVRKATVVGDYKLMEAQITDAPEPMAGEEAILEPLQTATPYTSLIDTIVGRTKLTILKPQNAVAKLSIGDSILDAPGPVLIAQAADVRRDNKQIVGAYVINGEMKSRGKAKSGFCAIINDKITIGVAQTTPLLEKATEECGFFFRQYPLVYEGEIIENKPTNLSQRKALATLNDEVVVILSHERLSFHDFSEALAGLGVTNAIYLVGSSAYLKARLEDGRIYEFGTRTMDIYPNSNYIFWQ